MFTRNQAGKVKKKNREMMDIPEEMPHVHGMQKWRK
jgi:hypothetical protein